MSNKGLTARVREGLRTLGAGGREIILADLAVFLDFVFDKEKQPMYRVLNDLRKTGEVHRVRRGVYVYNGKNKKPPELQEIMWRILRARRTVTIDDLVELAGASREYAEEWLYMLARRDVVKRTGNRQNGGWKYRLIQDVVERPCNTEKTEKLRRIRRQKREALAALEAAELAIRKAKEIVADTNR